MAQVTKDTLIGELLQMDVERVAPILMNIGMHCPSRRAVPGCLP